MSATEIPIFENEAQVGTLRVYTQGLYTVFQTKLPEENGYEYGESPPCLKGGAPVRTLGRGDERGNTETEKTGTTESPSLPRETRETAPFGQGSRSRAALTRLWLIGKCGAAAPLGLLRLDKEGRSFCRKMSRMECGRLPKNPVRALLLPNGEKPEKPEGNGGNGSSGTLTPTEKANHSQARIPGSESSWSALSDGSLIDRERRLLALPWGGGAIETPARKISLGEREYLLFHY